MIDWVAAAYRKSSSYDPDFAEGCLVDDSLTERLDVSFAQDDVATFLLDNIPDGGCEGPVVSVPLADIKGLMTAKAVDYFPALQSPEARR